MAPLAGVKFDAIAWKWKFVRSLRIAPLTAMPTAPPRLRIILNNPLAYLSRSGGKLPSPRLTLGATAKTWESRGAPAARGAARRPSHAL